LAKFDAASDSLSASIPVTASERKTLDPSGTLTDKVSAQAGSSDKNSGPGLSYENTQTSNAADSTKNSDTTKVVVKDGADALTYQQTKNSQGVTNTETLNFQDGDVKVQIQNADSVGPKGTSSKDSVQVSEGNTSANLSVNDTEGAKHASSETKALEVKNGSVTINASETDAQGADTTQRSGKQRIVVPGPQTEETIVGASVDVGGGANVQASNSNKQGASGGISYSAKGDAGNLKLQATDSQNGIGAEASGTLNIGGNTKLGLDLKSDPKNGPSQTLNLDTNIQGVGVNFGATNNSKGTGGAVNVIIPFP
jgi:hypothetical protein